MLSLILFKIALKLLADAIMQKQKINYIKIKEEKLNDIMIVYFKNPKESTKKITKKTKLLQ